MIEYRERLIPSTGIWLAALVLPMGAGVVLLPLNLVWSLIAALLVAAATAAALWNAAPVLTVDSNGVFTAGKAHIEGQFLTDATPIAGGQAASDARGRDLDARAFLVIRGWVDGLVRLGLQDPEDPTPYWLVSTRDPTRLAAAINSIRAH